MSYMYFYIFIAHLKIRVYSVFVRLFVVLVLNFITLHTVGASHPVGVQSIVIDVSVCLFVCLLTYLEKKHVQILPNVRYMLPMAVA